MATLAVDIETYSDINIKLGVYKYAESDNFKILLFAYAFDDAVVEIVDIARGDELPIEVAHALLDKNITKTAFNAQFERVCIDRHFGIKSVGWECTKIRAAYFGLSGSLENVGLALGLGANQQKLATGKNLIKLFSIDRKPSAANGNKVVFTASDKPEEWELFKEYCVRDVEAERVIRDKLSRFTYPSTEQVLYELDQSINDRGVLIDLEMAENAIRVDAEQRMKLAKRYTEVTGLINPNSLTELKKFITRITGEEVSGITKGNIEELKLKFEQNANITEALEIRQHLSKTSIAKYQKMIEVACKDKRARGLFQFYGANRTGRWAGRHIQPQNLPQNHIKDLDTARQLVKTADLEMLEMLYDSPANILSQCIRTALIPKAGHKFIVADFSAIEARVIAWLAGEIWRLEVFRTHGKIYEASASQMFKIPIEEITKGSPHRQKGKVAELACGYQGGVGALVAMGALDMGLDETELKAIINQWRRANPNIVRFWYATESAVIEAIEGKTTIAVNEHIKVSYSAGMLFIQLPNGRLLVYPGAKLVDHDKFEGKQKIIFKELNSNGSLVDAETYGGKLVENIVQATARDCLAESLIKLDRADYRIVMHVHDEVVIEIEEGRQELDRVCAIMGEPLAWALDLPLNADGYECKYYHKD